jgi:tetratricopeptide (TPR) repeat protein
MGRLQMDDNDIQGARKSLDSALGADPFDLLSLLNRARLYVREGNTEKAIPIYRALSSRDDSTREIEEELSALVKDAEVQVPEKIAEPVVPTVRENYDPKEHYDMGDTYDLALLALERAYTTGSAISDEKMLSKLGINGKKRDMVLNYLSDIEEYGEIDVGTKEFERMERLSKNVILAEKLDDIDSNPLVGIPAAYMASTAETVDDAKKLIAYIYKAMTSEHEPVAFSADVSEAAAEASEMSGDITTYNLMRMFNVGVYTARTIGSLSKMDRKKGTDMHI